MWVSWVGHDCGSMHPYGGEETPHSKYLRSTECLHPHAGSVTLDLSTARRFQPEDVPAGARGTDQIARGLVPPHSRAPAPACLLREERNTERCAAGLGMFADHQKGIWG